MQCSFLLKIIDLELFLEVVSPFIFVSPPPIKLTPLFSSLPLQILGRGEHTPALPPGSATAHKIGKLVERHDKIITDHVVYQLPFKHAVTWLLKLGN